MDRALGLLSMIQREIMGRGDAAWRVAVTVMNKEVNDET
jgi:hypothetical protein